MAIWGDVAAALPEIVASDNNAVVAQAPGSSGPAAPQAHGWVEKSAYNYDVYTKSSKEVEGDKASFEANGVEVGEWAGNAEVYKWDGEIGDIGPRFEALEKQLFGGENTQKGIDFEKIACINVTQEGNVRIAPVRTFKDAGLHPAMLDNVGLAGYGAPTPIQQYTLPAIKKGYDIVACAQTGSGKTAAFLIPILSNLMGKAKKLTAPRPNPATFEKGVTPGVRAEPLVLIICPSRELATQIFNEARRFCYRSMLRPSVIYGGGPLRDQIDQLAMGCDVLIGTPGRVCDFINRPHILSLKRLKYMVIDEADEMLQSDWEQELKIIMSGGDQEEGNINYLMFSATFPKIARDLAKDHLAHDHVRIRVGRAGSSHSNISQEIVFVTPSQKRKALEDLLLATPPARTIIFVNSKRVADEIDDFLFNKGFPCVSIHSDRTQREREDCIRSFRAGKNPILIATGVSARGLDVAGVMHVINFDLPSPQYGGIEEYTHRIGRTGRIGNTGLATSFFNDRDEDLGPQLVMTLLETRQKVPDFLEKHVPEGFTADGAESGDISKLKFDADSDDEVEEGGEEAVAAGDGWGAQAAPEATPTAAGWGSGPVSQAPAAPVATAPVTAGWGEAPVQVKAPPPSTPVASGWNATSTKENWDSSGGW